MWDTARQKVALSDFWCFKWCFKVMPHKQKVALSDFWCFKWCFKVMPHEQKVALSDFWCFKWCFMSKNLQSRILVKHRVKHQKSESATFCW